jgi:methionyl-tRNA formyltransferase
MKVLFITQNDPFYVRELFEEILKVHPRRDQIAGIVVAPAMGKTSLMGLIRQMWGFYGTFNFMRQGTRFVLYKIAAKLPRGLLGKSAFSIEQVAAAHGVRVLHVPDLNAPGFVSAVREMGIDVIASVAAPQVFKPPLIRAPRLGCINIHNSRLPKYRGMLPNFWQMYSGETSVGTSVHRINEQLDDGAILAQVESPIVKGESLDALIRRTKKLGAHLLSKTLLALEAGTVTEMPNPQDQGTYFTFPTSADVREFRRRGYRLM